MGVTDRLFQRRIMAKRRCEFVSGNRSCGWRDPGGTTALACCKYIVEANERGYKRRPGDWGRRTGWRLPGVDRPWAKGKRRPEARLSGCVSSALCGCTRSARASGDLLPFSL